MRGGFRLLIDRLYYDGACACCSGHFHNDAPSFSFSTDVLQQYLRAIYNGFDSSRAVEPTMWREVLRILNEATVSGLLQSKAPTHEDNFLAALRHSNEVFAAFKVHSMSERMAARLLNDDGTLKPFRQWADDVQPIASHYVGAWLRTEYDTALIRAHNAADWQQFLRDADIMPNLRWMPTTSPTPESSHRAFWERKLTLPVSDPFWDEHHPGDRWNCKCSLEQTDDPPTPELKAEFAAEAPQPGLTNNPGKDGHTFSQDHPYFPKSCGSCPFNKGVKNRLLTVFKNEEKHCYNCSKINFVLPKTKEGMKNVTAEQKHEIYSMPIERQFDEVKKNIFKHILKSTDEEDYKRLEDVAQAYADKGVKVWILPEIHKSEVDIRQRIGLPSDTQTPDFWLDKKVLVDAKSPRSYKKITHNANGASEQGGIACITNHFIKLEPAKLAALSKRIFENGGYTKKEVHFYIDGTLYKYNSQGIILD